MKRLYLCAFFALTACAPPPSLPEDFDPSFVFFASDVEMGTTPSKARQR